MDKSGNVDEEIGQVGSRPMKLDASTASIVAAFAGREAATVSEVVDLARRLSGEVGPAFPIGQGAKLLRAEAVAQETPKVAKAVPAIDKSKAITPDTVYCMCCGRGFTMLKRHLKAEHGLTEDQYRAMFDLPEDFALVAPNYSARKASYAKKIGLGKYEREGSPVTSEASE